MADITFGMRVIAFSEEANKTNAKKYSSCIETTAWLQGRKDYMTFRATSVQCSNLKTMRTLCFKVGHVFQVAKICSVYIYVCFCVFTCVSTEAQLNLLAEKRHM
jgi:hypothetical protein